MASSALTGKLETDVEIKASPEQFHDMFTNKPHHVHHACNDEIQGYGKPKTVKDEIEAVDPDKNLITFRVLEGDILEEYKSFAVTIQASPKSGGTGSVVHWTLEYEKLHDGVDHPEDLLEFVKEVSNAIDAHVTKPN
ncbi:MLP-like protein 28 [Hibiscus syriacus]|uniref:MLP-like protein 28 n=1 Tax=Hibiscus syriacus TaxID=106335 RepID=A0A6A3CL52_HIBSY|nr:MLP-like protein 28 [Hibiscus syriacus]